MNSERQHRVSILAHRIWEAEGKPAGQEARHWYMACRLVEAGERVALDQSSHDREAGSPVRDDLGDQ